ncbi:hypothetical protein BH23BAC1_BH23BAC1_29020 [soil metagenome]
MKVTYKRLGVLATIGYLLGILVVTYFLLNLPQELENKTIGLSASILSQLNLAFVKLNISIVMVLALGMTAALLLLFNDKKKEILIKPENAGPMDDPKAEILESEQDQSGLTEVHASKIIDLLSFNKNLKLTSDRTLSAVCTEIEASQGAVYIAKYEGEKRVLQLIASFAYPIADSKIIEFEFGEGLVGQAANENRILNIESVPEGYLTILSGLGKSTPTNLLIVPFLNFQVEKIWGVVEIASFNPFSANDERLILEIFSALAENFSKEQTLKAPVTKIRGERNRSC